MRFSYSSAKPDGQPDRRRSQELSLSTDMTFFFGKVQVESFSDNAK